MTPTELADAYLAGAQSLRDMVAGMTRDQLTARPVPGRWSTLEVVAHVTDMDAVFADRMKRIIAAPDGEPPLLLVADENRYAAAMNYHNREVGEELALLDATRRQMARIIRSLTPAQLQRPGVHTVRGLQTLEQVIRVVTNHIQHHLPFVAEKKQALGIG